MSQYDNACELSAKPVSIALAGLWSHLQNLKRDKITDQLIQLQLITNNRISDDITLLGQRISMIKIFVS